MLKSISITAIYSCVVILFTKSASYLTLIILNFRNLPLLLSDDLLSRYTLLLPQLDVQSHPMQSVCRSLINAHLVLAPAVNMLFLDNAAPDSCCAERPLHIPTYPRLASTAATVREKTCGETKSQIERPTDYNNPSLRMRARGLITSEC